MKELKPKGNRKESVLIISPFFRPNIGGVETHLDDLCEYLRRNDYKVFVVTYQPLTTKAKGPKLEMKENLEIHRIRWFGYNLFPRLEPYPVIEFLYLFPGLFICSFIFLLRHKKDVDVIHAHGFVSASITMVLAKCFRKRSILSSHAIYNLDRRPFMSHIVKKILSSFDMILCLSKQSKRELVDIGLDERKIAVYTYWVDQNIFKPMDRGECKRELGWENKFIALFTGRFIEIKGVRLLMEVAKTFSSEADGIHLAFIGDGPLAEEIRKVSAERDNAIFIGKIDNNNLTSYYNAADVVVVPSLYEEGFGRVIIEALSCGTPVIASNRGGIPEAMDSSVGFVIEPEEGEIANAIAYLNQHPDELENLRENCRKYAEARFSENNAEVIVNAYKD